MLLLTVLGATLGVAFGVAATCALAFLCRRLKKLRRLFKIPENKCLESTAKERNILHTAQQFRVKKTMEPVQPRNWLTSPKIYGPKPVITLLEFINCTDYTLERMDERLSARGEEANISSLMVDSSEDLFVISKSAPTDAVSLSDDAESEISEDWKEDVKLHYGIHYNRYKSELYLTIIEAQNINMVENMNHPDSYVVAALITKLGKAKAETSIQTKTLHPIWQDTLTFPVLEEHVQEGTLTLAVYSCDKYSRQDCVGEAQLKLSSLAVGERTDSWISLTAPVKDSSHGEILLSISYLPAANRLIVVVMKAQHLNTDKLKDPLDVSIKLTLMHQSLKLKRKHTRHVKHKINPVWNEMIMFECPYEMLCKSSLELELLNQDCTGQNHLLGKCSLGMNYSDSELNHWQEMLTKPRKQIAMWHKLHE
ncbi:synaptotagmin-13 [Pristis pectinata]|uniref:synaptotagmin-13 n=1 Tax=Pristis pectinata TaxID=685728 RepID=UPI00223DA433|nr:synaptotagmin-13 [Pristis pectinata]